MKRIARWITAGTFARGVVFFSIFLLAPGFAAGAGEEFRRATFAGGCFWCMEPPFEKLEGVKEVLSGYTGGPEENPSYSDVSSGGTGHVEAVLVRYDPTVVAYADLLEVFWRQVDPTDDGGQFVDRGNQYRTAIFTHDDEQRREAESSLAELEGSGIFEGEIVTPIRPAGPFYPAEDYHQDYYKKSPLKYKFYRLGSGRDRFLKKIWGGRAMKTETSSAQENKGNWRNFSRPPQEELRKILTPEQYRVTQEEGTERPYQNDYHNSKKKGIYVDIVSGEPLFSSLDKYDSGTGWPSFYRPLEPENMVYREDRKLFMPRTELKSRHGGSHLGHVFGDGPPPTGKRFCINSAALRFVPAEDLESKGYGEYADLFR